MKNIFLTVAFLLCSVFSFAAADLTVTEVYGPLTAYSGSFISVSANCANKGDTKVKNFIVNFYMSSSPSFNGGSLISLGTAWGTDLFAGSSTTVSGSFMLPVSVYPSVWYIYAVVKSRDAIDNNPSNDGKMSRSVNVLH